MIIYPAIDLKTNRCVRLVQGDFKNVKVYDQNPLNVARAWIESGAEYLHVVDLDGAQSAHPINLPSIKEIVALGVPVQVGGGIRTLDRAETLLDLGVSRVIVGTMAINDLDLLKTLINRYPTKIIVSIDALHGMVRTHGWQRDSTIKAIDLAQTLECLGIQTIVYTDIEKDGMLKGPNFADYEALVKQTTLEIIASGGVTSLNDLKRLKEMGVHGTIIGKALYEKRIDLKEALRCLQNESSPV